METPAYEPTYERASQLARRLGVCVRSVHRLRRAPDLPAGAVVQFSRTGIRFDSRRIQEWLANRSKVARAEAATK